MNYFEFPCKAECDGWIRTAILLVEELSGETIEESENEEENGNGEAVKTMHAEPSNRSAAWVREIYSLFVGRKVCVYRRHRRQRKGCLWPNLLKSKVLAFCNQQPFPSKSNPHSLRHFK